MKTSDQVKAEKNHLLYDPNATTLTEKVDVYSRKYQILALIIPCYLPTLYNASRAALFNFIFWLFSLASIEIVGNVMYRILTGSAAR
jgi:hypothetical protein